MRACGSGEGLHGTHEPSPLRHGRLLLLLPHAGLRGILAHLAELLAGRRCAGLRHGAGWGRRRIKQLQQLLSLNRHSAKIRLSFGKAGFLRFWDQFRAGDFVTLERARIWAGALLIAYIAALAYLFATAHGISDYRG